MGLPELLLKEASVRSVDGYRRRVRALAALYVTLAVLCAAGEWLLIAKGRLFVTLAQRSNVETLTLAFFLVYYAYVGALSLPGAAGALRLALASLGRGAARESRKARSLARRKRRRYEAMLNSVVEVSGRVPPLALPIRDRHGELGRLEFDGVRLVHHESPSDGSNELFAFVAEKVTSLQPARLDVVDWPSLDDESSQKYASLASFALGLEGAVGGAKLWPRVVLGEKEWDELGSTLTELCPVLRSEAFLPDWEYAGEHKLPIIPEPLGIVSLGRSEKRVDPLVSLGATFFVVLTSLALLGWFTWRPPWVPGT
jgi:hypothetical protein